MLPREGPRDRQCLHQEAGRFSSIGGLTIVAVRQPLLFRTVGAPTRVPKLSTGLSCGSVWISTQ